jgi:hypothetical protein
MMADVCCLWCAFWTDLGCNLCCGYEAYRSAYPGQQIISICEIESEMSIIHGNKRYRNCLRPNRIHFILTESGNLLTDGPNVFESRDIACKSNICLTTVWLFYQNLIKLPLMFSFNFILLFSTRFCCRSIWYFLQEGSELSLVCFGIEFLSVTKFNYIPCY